MNAEMDLKTEIINRQKAIKVDLAAISDFADTLVSVISETKGRFPSVVFVDDKEMIRLNTEYRGKDSTTDVLSFVIDESDVFEDDSLGEIVVSIEQALRQSIENGLTLGLEIRQLLLHGVLHLCGFDHETDEGQMNTRELELRRQLGIE